MRQSIFLWRRQLVVFGRLVINFVAWRNKMNGRQKVDGRRRFWIMLRMRAKRSESVLAASLRLSRLENHHNENEECGAAREKMLDHLEKIQGILWAVTKDVQRSLDQLNFAQWTRRLIDQSKFGEKFPLSFNETCCNCCDELDTARLRSWMMVGQNKGGSLELMMLFVCLYLWLNGTLRSPGRQLGSFCCS